MTTDAERDAHYNEAVQAWDNAYADRNDLPRFQWATQRVMRHGVEIPVTYSGMY